MVEVADHDRVLRRIEEGGLLRRRGGGGDALGDVLVGAVDARDLPLVVPLGLADHPHPDLLLRVRGDRELQVEGGPVGGAGGQRHLQTGAVRRRVARDHVVQRQAPGMLVGVEDHADLVRPVHRSVGHLDGPAGDAGCRASQPEQRLAAVQALLCDLPLRDVLHGRGQVLRCIVRPAQHRVVRPAPEHPAVAAQVALVDDERRHLSGEERGDPVDVLGAVSGVRDRQEASPAELGEGVAHHVEVRLVRVDELPLQGADRDAQARADEQGSGDPAVVGQRRAR